MSLKVPELHSVEQVAKELGLHARTVRAYLRTGRLKGARIGKQYRIRREDLDALIGRSSSLGPEPQARHQYVDVSAIVQVDAISPESVRRVTNMLMAAAQAPRGEDHPLRINTSHDHERARLKLFVSGSIETTVAMLRLLDKLTEPESA